MKERENAPTGDARAILRAGAMANIADIAQTKAMLRRLARFNRASICSVSVGLQN
jgi:hypothetical protein